MSLAAKRRVKVRLKFIGQLLVGLLLFLLLICLSDFSSLKRLTTLRLLPLLGAFLSTLGIAVSVGLRWGTLARGLVNRPIVSWWHFVYYFLLNRVLGFFVPKDLSDLGGRAALLVTKHEVPLALAGLSVVTDRLSDVLIMLIFLVPSVLFLSHTVEAGAALIIMGSLMVVVYLGIRLGHRRILVLSVTAYNHFASVLHRLPVLRRRPLKRIQNLELSLKVFQRVYMFSLMKFAFTALRWMFFALALDIPEPMITFLFGTPVGQLSFLFAFTPGGLGIFEAGWYAILLQAGLSEAYISPLLVEQRVFTMLFVGLAMLFSSLLLLWKKSTASRSYTQE